MRCPSASLRARCVARSGRGLRKLVRCAAFGHAQPCFRPALRYSPAHDGASRVRTSPQGTTVARRAVRIRSRLCRPTGLSSTGARGSDIRVFEGRAAD